MLKKSISILSKCIWLSVPCIIGFFGFMLDGNTSVPDALFNCLIMYFLNYGDTPVNKFVGIARWLAPLATLSGILFAVSFLKETIRNFIVYRLGKSVAVYGSEADCQIILSQIGKNGIQGTDHFVKAQKYILTFREKENLEFYEHYKDKFKRCSIYMKCESLPAQMISGDNIKLYSIEEIAAGLFWKEFCIFSLAKENGYHLDIIFLGFGKLGEELLYHGLLNNVFSPAQKLRYHIFGNCKTFINTHTQLKSISDEIIMHSESWHESTLLIENADVIVLIEQDHQMQFLRDITLAIPQKKIIVFAESTTTKKFLSDYTNLSIIDWKTECNNVEYIIGEKQLYLAKSINLKYANLYSGVEINNVNLDIEWKKLNTFTRYSNISAADYHEIRLKMMTEMGIPFKYDEIPRDVIDLLTELEHIRWCRYHYLHNWKYGIPDNRKNKDSLLRIHKDLVDYSQLTEADIVKDRDNIKLLLDIHF